MNARWWPVREDRLLIHTLILSLLKSMEGGCGRDRVRRCRLLTPEIVVLFIKICKQGGKLYYSRYSLCYH